MKKNYYLLLIPAIILFILLGNNLGLFVSFGNFYKIGCSDNVLGILPCFSSYGSLGGNTFDLDNVPHIDYFQGMIYAWGQSNPKVTEFWGNSYICHQTSGGSSKKFQSDKLDLSKYDFLVGPYRREATSSNPCTAYYVLKEDISSHFSQNQLMVINGYFEETGTEVTTYAMCSLTERSCTIKEPETGFRAGGNDVFYPNTLKLYLKFGGYTEDNSLCVEDGIEKCEGNVLSICQNFKLVSQGNVEGKCGYTELEPEIPETPENQTCTESWNCGVYSNCINNLKTRTCTDANNCGTTISKPSLTLSCTTSDDTDVQETPERNNLIFYVVIGAIIFILAFIIWGKK